MAFAVCARTNGSTLKTVGDNLVLCKTNGIKKFELNFTAGIYITLQ